MRTRVIVLLLVAVLAVVAELGGAASAPATASPIRAADVHGDNGLDRYVGTGGLVLPRSVGAAPRAEVAGCGDCHWRLATPCALELPGVAFPGQTTCLSVVRGCPGMAQLLRVWFDGGGGWRDLGLICLGPGGPVTIRLLAGLARESFVKDLPPLHLHTAPSTGIVAQLPVIFDSGQPGGAFAVTYSLAGEQVEVTGRPRWAWRFGDGGALTTEDPGGSYPHLAVSHPYREAGPIQVAVEADWTASFRVDGLGPFPIREPVTQTAEHSIVVGEGRAVLAVR